MIPSRVKFFNIYCVLGAWTASVQNDGQYLAIDFGKDYIVTKVMTQGRQGSDEYVTEFTLEFSSDNKTWTEYTNEFGITEVIIINPFNTNGLSHKA